MVSMFERYGGFSSVRRVVADFYDEVLDTPSLSHHFADTDMRALIEHQTVFISYLMGGPGAGYSDAVLERVHAPLGISDDEFEDMIHLLSGTLADHGIAAEDVAEVEAQFRAREGLIVTQRLREGST